MSVHNLLGGSQDLAALSGRFDSVCEKKKSVQSPLPEVSANKVHFSRHVFSSLAQGLLWLFYTYNVYYVYLQIQRSVNYKKAVAVVEKWDPIVKHNREVCLSASTYVHIHYV